MLSPLEGADVNSRPFSRLFAVLTGEQLKILLETRHLYQKVSIQPNDIITKLMGKVSKDQHPYYAGEIRKGLQGRLTPTETPTYTGLNTLELWLPVKNIKLFCVKCDAREAFRPIWYSDITLEIRAKHKKQRMLETETFKIQFLDNFQLFALVYQCQICESLPTAFIVKRDGTDLFLEGRSPIEHVELPKFIPKQEQKWFRDAVIAFQSGKILALYSTCGHLSNSSLVEKQTRWKTRRQATQYCRGTRTQSPRTLETRCPPLPSGTTN